MKYELDSYLLFLFQFIAHIGAIYAILNFELHWFLLSLMVYFITGCIGITMTYHRLLSHKSWKSPTFFSIIGVLSGFYGLVGSSIAWIATHREHHVHTDKKGDPHSPVISGFSKTQFFSMFYTPKLKYCPDLIRSKFHTVLHKNYFKIHALIILLLLSIDFNLLLWGYFVPNVILWHAGSLINTLNHSFGYINHIRQDNSKNNIITGILVWGEGWHNNHHYNPKNYSFKYKWWEIDIGALLINLIKVKNDKTA